jgi:hypothetical protein
MARYSVLGLCCAAVVSATVAAARHIEAQARSGEPDTSVPVQSDYTNTRSFRHLRGTPWYNPDEKQRKRLWVCWEKSSMGFFDMDETTAKKEWRDSDDLGDIAITGRLFLVSEDGKTTKPVDWVQGVRVVLAHRSNAKPDWSKRHDLKDSTWSDCLIEQDGTFRALFKPNRIRRRVGRTENFQLGLSLGTRLGSSISWTNSSPILPQTVTRISIAGPQPLSATMQAINGAPSATANRFDPVMLVRAVNHLHALGKDKAIAELYEFLKIARYNPHVERDPANIDTSHYECVFLIVRLLFEPAEAGDRLPPMHAFAPPPDKDEALWPLFPLALQDDIPFIVGEPMMLQGSPELPSPHVAWAARRGKLRARPLRPADDPLRAVDKLMALPQTARLNAWPNDFSDRGDLRRQGWKTIAHLARRPAGSQDFWHFHGKYDANADWAVHKRIAAKLKIRWDDKLQKYVAP